MFKKIGYIIVFLLLFIVSGCDESEDFKGAGASSISYPLNTSPLTTDQALGIDDPAGTWAINRFSFGDVFTLYLTQDFTFTGAIDTTNATSNTSGPIALTPTPTLPTGLDIVDGKIFPFTGLAGFLSNSVFTMYDGTTPVYYIGIETPPTTTGETIGFNSVTGKWDIVTPSGGSFAFDTYPVYEDSAHTSGIAVNATTLAIYSDAASKWLTVGLTDSLDPTPIIPTFTSATVDGLDLQVIFSTPVSQGAGWLETLFTVDGTVTGVDIGMTFVDTDGTDTWNFTLDTAMVETDIVTLDYPTTANGVESSTGDDLAALVAESVTNNTSGTDYTDCSEQGTWDLYWNGDHATSDLTFCDGLAGTGTATLTVATIVDSGTDPGTESPESGGNVVKHSGSNERINFPVTPAEFDSNKGSGEMNFYIAANPSGSLRIKTVAGSGDDAMYVTVKADGTIEFSSNTGSLVCAVTSVDTITTPAWTKIYWYWDSSLGAGNSELFVKVGAGSWLGDTDADDFVGFTTEPTLIGVLHSAITDVCYADDFRLSLTTP